MAADWSIAVGILVYIVAIITAIVLYVKYNKISQVIFVASVATYIFAVLYTWDVFFDNRKNMVMLLLIVSTIVMIFIGKYFSGMSIKQPSAKKRR